MYEDLYLFDNAKRVTEKGNIKILTRRKKPIISGYYIRKSTKK